MPAIDVGRQSVSFREQGEGFPAILLVHGAGGSSLGFIELLAVMGGRGRRLVALDLPGHGSSPPFDPPPSPSGLLEAYRDLIAAFGERIGLGRFVLVGHSMGGAVGQLFALAHPDRLEALVLVATAARLKVAPALLETIRHHFDRLPTFFAATGYSPATDRGRVERWSTSQIQAPREQVLADFLACARFDLRDQVAAITCPTWILSAVDDLLTPPALQEQLKTLIPRARLEPISRAGHFLPMERADRLARPILAAAGVEDAAGGPRTQT